ncbi:MAG: isoprenyl transferase [Verrucomicrobia bacterium]|nr:isoprenyl transferase [Verrucomicrobiota bacterium]
MTDASTRRPRHVAIIMDGNGRWAQSRGLPRIRGHEEGSQSVRAIVRACRDMGVEYLTLYAFSVENWVRPPSEISGLMRLLSRFLKEREFELHENQVRLRVIGRLQDLPKPIQRGLNRVMKATQSYDKGQLILALSYGGRTEIAAAAKQIARDVAAGKIDPESVDEESIRERLYAPDIPDPDLLIRTSGEMRISNFLLWQISYSELYVTDTPWPEFREAEFQKALEAYSKRKRRYGDTVEHSEPQPSSHPTTAKE